MLQDIDKRRLDVLLPGACKGFADEWKPAATAVWNGETLRRLREECGEYPARVALQLEVRH